MFSQSNFQNPDNSS